MTGNIKVLEISPEAWLHENHLLETGLFLTPEWLTSLSDENNSAIYLRIEKEGDLIGRIAGLVLDNGRIKGKVLYFFSGPVMADWNAERWEECLNGLYEFAKTKSYARVFIKTFDYHVSEGVEVNGYIKLLSGEFLLDFEKCKDGFKLSSNFRRNVAKAEKLLPLFYKSRSLVHLDKLFDLIAETRQTRAEKYGSDYDPMYMANLNKATLRNLLQSGIGVLNCVEINERVHSVLFSLEKEGKMYFLLMGSDEFAYKNGLPAYLSFKILTDALNQGCKYYNMGLVPSDAQGGQGVRRNKEAQGAVERISYSYYTLYLNFPMKCINSFIRLSKKLPENVFFDRIRRLIG